MKRYPFAILIILCFLLSTATFAFSAPPAKAKAADKQTVVSKKQASPSEKKNTRNVTKTRNVKAQNTKARTTKAQTPKDGQKLRADKGRKANVRVRAAAGNRSSRTVRAAVAPVEPVQTDGEFVEYKVRRGDTLEKVALRFGLERDDIVESNNNLGRRLTPGRTLLIPKVGEQEKEQEYVNLPGRFIKSWKTNDEKILLVKVAKSFMGAPYRYGGNSVRGLDCSAFVRKIYDIFDVQLPRSARDQYKVGPKVTKDDLAVGDLVFFRTKRYVKYPTHVGIYIGDGNFIHSSSAHCKIGVRIDSLRSDFYTRTFIGATRVKKAPDPEESPEEVPADTEIPEASGHNS